MIDGPDLQFAIKHLSIRGVYAAAVRRTKTHRPDFAVSDHGSIFLLRPITDAAMDWVNEHLPEDAVWFGPSVAVEHRYIANIVAGARADGLVVR